jgi:hypothetical protein
MNLQLILKGALILTGLLALSAQGSNHLYLVTAIPTPSAPAVPSALWQVAGQRLEQVSALTDADAGANVVAVNHDRRLLVLGTPHQRPTKLVIVNMDAPAAVRSVPVSVPTFALPAGLFLEHPQGLLFSVRLLKGQVPVLVGIDLASGTTTELPSSAYSGVRRDGWWAPADGFNGNVDVTLKDGKLIGAVGEVATFDLGVAPPKTLAPEPGAFSLTIRNDAMLVLDRPSVRGKTAGVSGRVQLEIYDRGRGTWSTEHFSGGGSSVRAFKEWLAVNEGDIKRDLTKSDAERKLDERISTGALERQRVVNPQAETKDQFTVDTLFAESSGVFSGAFELLNIRSGKRYRVATGQGDSEVLLVDATAVYYRVNDTLYRAQIGKDGIERSEQLLKDPNVQLAHWAFLAP